MVNWLGFLANMSLYDRLNFTKPNQRNHSVPIWERINFDRPQRSRLPRCKGCRLLIKSNWRICPQCGLTLSLAKTENYHCIWINAEALGSDSIDQSLLIEALEDSFAKVFSAFRSIHVFLTSDPPDQKKWGENFTYLGLIVDREDVDYLGIASFREGAVTDRAIVRLDQIISISNQVNLSSGQLSNLIANTIAHEIGHTLGLDHSVLPTDVMHDGLDHRVHSLMPPSFHAEQITQMNYAIYRYKYNHNG
jgi:predicted Zn-dependent protease with MMP-like domain